MTSNEWLLLALNVWLACLLISHLDIVPAGARRWIEQLMTARGIPLAIVVACSLGLCISVQLRHGPPLPRIHDEFSYLLAGDTFASLRWANPTHACWPHFETMHVLQQPTYTSKYPPGQGMVLAIGSLLGAPIFGVWLSLAAACGAVCWMLRGWFGPRWAVLGGVLVAVRVTTSDYPGEELVQKAYWAHSFWGGGVAALGGALTLGGIRRLDQSRRWTAAASYACGLGVMASSRPFEGLLVSLPTLVLLGHWSCRWRREQGWPGLFRTLGPAGLTLGLFAALIGWHSLRTTGHPLRMPHGGYQQTYAVTPMTLLQPLRPEPVYRHAMMREFHLGWEASEFAQQLDSSGYLAEKAKRLRHLWEFFLGAALTVPLLIGVFSCGDRWIGLALIMICLPLAAHAITPWMHPHYMAPALAPLTVLVVAGLRRIATSDWIPFRLGIPLAVTLVVISLAGSLASVWEQAPRRSGWESHRQRIIDRLHRMPGKHLVIVHYAPGHSPHQEWVYNRADIDAARIVWARDMGRDDNRHLIEYFGDRQQWLCHVTGSRAVVERYRSAERETESGE